MDVRGFILDYEHIQSGFTLIGIEAFITAIIIGVSEASWGTGILTFLIICGVFAVPLLGGILMLAFSLAESILVGMLLLNIASPIISWIIGIIVFVITVSLHQAAIGIDESIFGYSLLLFEILVVSFMVYMQFQSLPLGVFTFAILLICMFLPYIRYIESIALSILTSLALYYLSVDTTGKMFSIAISILIFILSSVFCITTNMQGGIDTIFNNIKLNNELRKHTEEYEKLKIKLYSQYPDLEKEHYYYITCVCKNDIELFSFETDWRLYLENIEKQQTSITSFNNWFEENQRYIYSNYNKEFAKEYHKNKQSKANNEKEEFVSNSSKLSEWFKGVSDSEGLKKRYRDLLKIYHPDNNAGDTFITQQIQDEYNRLLTENNWS